MVRHCRHLSAEYVQRRPCRPCVHCRGWIDARGRVMSDATALRRYPQHAAEIDAQPMRPGAQAPGLSEQFVIVIAALVAVMWRLALLILALPILALAYMLCWSLIAN